jgi:hypothetical protein
MRFVSYARNAEDVMLWRALRDLPAGRYVDAAASDQPSVTRAFYERGWRGVNVAASAPYHARLLQQRPEDVNLPASPLPRPGGAAPGGAVQFLRVDATADPADVIAWRPWIVLVAAKQPPAWEPALLQAGYRAAWFDGLTRFYLAEPQYPHLAAHFRVPPNSEDGFIRHDPTAEGALAAAMEARRALIDLREELAAARGAQAADSAALQLAREQARAAAAERDALAARFAETDPAAETLKVLVSRLRWDGAPAALALVLPLARLLRAARRLRRRDDPDVVLGAETVLRTADVQAMLDQQTRLINQLVGDRLEDRLHARMDTLSHRLPHADRQERMFTDLAVALRAIEALLVRE